MGGGGGNKRTAVSSRETVPKYISAEAKHLWLFEHLLPHIVHNEAALLRITSSWSWLLILVEHGWNMFKLCKTPLLNQNEQKVSPLVNIAHLHYLLLQPIAIWQILPEECSNFWCFFLNILDFVDSQQTCSPLLFYSEFLHQLAFPFYQPSWNIFIPY